MHLNLRIIPSLHLYWCTLPVHVMIYYLLLILFGFLQLFMQYKEKQILKSFAIIHCLFQYILEILTHVQLWGQNSKTVPIHWFTPQVSSSKELHMGLPCRQKEPSYWSIITGSRICVSRKLELELEQDIESKSSGTLPSSGTQPS